MTTNTNKQDRNDSPDIDNDLRDVARYADLGKEIGELVDQKNAAYGSAFDTVGEFLKLMYPTGILPEQYVDSLAIVRIFDKLKRIASIKNNTTKEQLVDAYSDIAGYGLLGLRRARSCNFDAAMDNAAEAETEIRKEKQSEQQPNVSSEESVDEGDRVALSLPLEGIGGDVVIKGLTELTREECASGKWLVLSKKRLTELVNGSFEPNCTKQRVVQRRYESPNERQADEKLQRLVRDRDEAIAKLAVATDKQTKTDNQEKDNCSESVRKIIEDRLSLSTSSEAPAKTSKEPAIDNGTTGSNGDIDAFIAFQKSELIPAGITDLPGAKLRLRDILDALTKHVNGVGANDNDARMRLQQLRSVLRGIAFLEAKELEKQYENNIYARWSKLVNAKPTKSDLRRAFEPVEVGVPSSKQSEQKSEELKP